ncbi:MAG: PIN domain-containing protein [Leptolyngbyaceae cyanobacterium bins.349]|nr:PIN domain-containing protein [Leptolyngbyaceae cyanobacterium bins.349]
MSDNIRSLFAQYRQKGILIDTNILLLYFVGSVNRDRISRFNRTEKFIPEDYDTLLEIIRFFPKRVTTPNILTEVNSLSNQLGEPERSNCLSIFAKSISLLDEHYIDSCTISERPEFVRFGLTDCGILEAAQNQYLVLTDDLKLSVHLQSQGVDVVNFNNIRVLNWS